jgi:hypothetical protein
MPQCNECEREWRVVQHHPHFPGPHIIACPNEEHAIERAAYEQAEYPHTEVWVESREVTPWTRTPALPGEGAPA